MGGATGNGSVVRWVCRKNPSTHGEGRPMDEITRPEHQTEVSAGIGHDAVATRDAARAARAGLARREAALEATISAQKAEIERVKRQMELDAAKLRADMEVLRAEMARATEILWTADLYLGRHEDIRNLRGGEPAPGDAPLTIRQKVLVMAEESLVLMGQKVTGMDAEDVPHFILWLLEDDAHLDRVLPEPKGVVVLVPTRVESHSGNIFEDVARNSQNQRAYWLIRNGQRLHLMTTDPDLRVGERVLPNRREFTDIFTEREFGIGTRRPVVPGSDKWLKLEKDADARRRHYMRLMLVLQGLIDRTPVWHPLPAEAINLLDVRAQDTGRVVLIQDDDSAALLDDGRPSFRDWQRALNARLRPGMRVIGNWGITDFERLYVDGDRWTRGFHPRVSPGRGPYPDTDVPHLVEGRRDGGFVIRYKRTDTVWRRDPYYGVEEEVVPSRRASCVVMADDTWVLALDLASAEDLHYYLNSRTNRGDHFLSMVPTIRAALAAKDAEATDESDFRRLLVDLLTTAGAENADSQIDALIHRWKIANAWYRALTGDPTHERKAATQIVDTWQRAQSAHSEGATMVARGKALPGALAVAQRRSGAWVAITKAEGAHDTGVFVHLTSLRRDGKPGTTDEWKTLAPRQVAALTIVWEADEWAEWTLPTAAKTYLSEPQRRAIIDEIVAGGNGSTVCVTETWDPKHPDKRAFTRYDWAPERSPEEHPSTATDDPYSWRAAPALVTASTHRITHHTGSGPALAPEATGSPHFARYTVAHTVGDATLHGIPWWPDTETRYSEARPRLTWLDEDMFTRLARYAERCREAHSAARSAHRDRDRTAYRWVEPILRLIETRAEDAAREEFIADYGSDSMDLWPAHRDRLNIQSPIHARTLFGIIAIALDHHHPVTGQTLDQLADHALSRGNDARSEWHPSPGKQDMKGYGDLVVPEPQHEDDPIPRAPRHI